MTRVAVFIDGSNLYRCVKDQFNRIDIDIEKLTAKLLDGRELTRIYYYNAEISEADDREGARDQQRFFTRLSYVPYLQLRKGKLVRRDIEFTCPGCRRTTTVQSRLQKGVDTRMVMDIVAQAMLDRYDVAVVVSGDADFGEALQFVRDHTNKRVENAFTTYGWAPDLRPVSDRKIILDASFLSDCWLEAKPPQEPG